MILNPDKCYFLTLGFQDAQPNFSYDNTLQSKMYQKKKYWALLLIIS